MEKNYISINNGIVEMPLSIYRNESEVSYFSFVIGYELLNKINVNGIYECDLLYDFANYIARDYIDSEEYKDTKYSSYDMFYKYIERKGGIQKLFDEYFKVESNERN